MTVYLVKHKRKKIINLKYFMGVKIIGIKEVFFFKKYIRTRHNNTLKNILHTSEAKTASKKIYITELHNRRSSLHSLAII